MSLQLSQRAVPAAWSSLRPKAEMTFLLTSSWFFNGSKADMLAALTGVACFTVGSAATTLLSRPSPESADRHGELWWVNALMNACMEFSPANRADCISNNKVSLCSLVDKLCNGTSLWILCSISHNAKTKPLIQHGRVCLCARQRVHLPLSSAVAASPGSVGGSRLSRRLLTLFLSSMSSLRRYFTWLDSKGRGWPFTADNGMIKRRQI